MISEIQNAQQAGLDLQTNPNAVSSVRAKKTNRKADMKRIHRKERFIFAIILPFMVAMIGAMLIWYFMALSNL